MYRRWETDSQEETQMSETVLTKMKAKLSPANDIISKQIKADDEIPRLKLLKPKPSIILQTKIIDPPKAPAQIIKLIKNAMNDSDSLLKYFESRQKDLLYLRSDNIDKMRLDIDGKIVNYFAGHFEDITNNTLEKQNKILGVSAQNKRRQSVINFIKPSFYSANYHISFDSCYQSGNLFAAFRVSQKANEFQLVMQNDVNSRGNTQWFNFKCKLPKGTFVFNIINYTKNDSLYNYGMKVSTYSSHNKVWSKNCQNISYYNSNIFRQNSNKEYYTLSFQYTNQYDSDIVTFANCYPSTYSEILNRCEKKINKKITKIVICKTYLGLDLFAIKIEDSRHQSSSNSFNSSCNDVHSKKKSLIFMARQHPGQTPASLVMDGLIESLLNYGQFQALKKQFVIYLIPVMNPDGVIKGNYRTNYSGCDLNRKWRYPNKNLHPEVYFTRRFLSNINRQNPIVLIVDSHGHSKKFNSFFYGNPPSDNPNMNDTRLFPYICSLKCSKISFSDCTFNVSQDKKNTARVVLNEMFPLAAVYTLQSSFSGYKLNDIHHQFTINQYKAVGKSLLQGFIQYYQMKRINFNQSSIKQAILSKQNKDNRQDSGSDSQPEEDVINEINIARKNNDALIQDVPQKQKSPTSYKNSKSLKRTIIRNEPRTKDQSTQTQKKYFVNQINKPKSIQQSNSVLRIFQLKSSTPEIKSRISDDKANSRKMIAKLANKKARLFGSSFTVKLWNKANINISSQDGMQNELQFQSVFCKGKK